KSIREQLDVLLGLDPDVASFYILTPIPGTEQYDDFLARGWITEQNLDRLDGTRTTWRHPNLSWPEWQGLLFDCYRKFYSPRHILMHGLKGFQRYRDNFLREQDGIALYHALAKAEKDPARSEIFRKLAKAEERHAARWSRLLKNNGAPVPPYKPGWRILVLGWLSRRFGTQHILPVVTGLESRDQDVYRGQAEAVGIPAEERSHMRTVRGMQRHGEDRPESILDLEGWHRTIYGGSLRAAVFGANDGLLSNFSLVMGIAGATSEPRFVLLAGIAGLLAGASSMAAGEYVSVQSQRELYEQQIAI